MILSVVDGVLKYQQSVSTSQQITAKQRLVFRDTRKYLKESGAQRRALKKTTAFFAMKHFENLNFFLADNWTILQRSFEAQNRQNWSSNDAGGAAQNMKFFF